jgi:hypothetical protein
VAFADGGRYLVAATARGTVSAWRPLSSKTIAERNVLPPAGEGGSSNGVSVRSIAVDPSSDRMAVLARSAPDRDGACESSIGVFAVPSLRQQSTLTTKDCVDQLAFRPNRVLEA